jgi:hypothetical protein
MRTPDTWVPRQWQHLIHCHGVLTPNAKPRAQYGSGRVEGRVPVIKGTFDSWWSTAAYGRYPPLNISLRVTVCVDEQIIGRRLQPAVGVGIAPLAKSLPHLVAPE